MSEDQDHHHQLYFHHHQHRYHGGGGDAALPIFPNYPSPAVVDVDPSTPYYYNMTSFTDCLHGSADHYNSLAKAFSIDGSSPPPPMQQTHQSTDHNAPVSTPNSSVSFSSSEAGGEELDSGSFGGGHHKGTPGKAAAAGDHQAAVEDGEGGDDNSNSNTNTNNCSHNKKEKSKGKKAPTTKAAGGGEKRQREPRFAFMTKSEVDHLEDGYRWRKYGQKAVKNSPYPRSYYRCTTQRCGVKKRVERSFEDPSVVITTYEGQHNHPLPSTLRGNAAAMFSHHYSMLGAPNSPASSSFPAEFLLQLSSSTSSSSSAAGAGSGGAGSLVYPQGFGQQEFFHRRHHNQQQQLQFSAGGDDYGLLQDVVDPSMFFRQEP